MKLQISKSFQIVANVLQNIGIDRSGSVKVMGAK